MEDKNCKQLLRNPDQIPNEELFKEILSKQLLETYIELQKIISGYGLIAEWRYYKDGNSWLCKVIQKKKTIVWISLWENFFKSSFFFTEKSRSGIERLNIDKGIKVSFSKTKSIGKLIPVILDLGNVSELENFKKLIDYKLSLK